MKTRCTLGGAQVLNTVGQQMVNRLSLCVSRGKGSQKLEENTRAPNELFQANP